MKRQPGSMAAAMRSTMAAESTAKAPLMDAIEEKMRRADGLTRNVTVLPSPAPTTSTPPATTRKRKAPKRVRTSTRRDSFNLPPEDHALLQATMERALALGTWTTKSSVVRAGLRVLSKLPDVELRQMLLEAHPLKPGRKPAR